MEKIKIIILAAGKGRRMRSDLPKVLVPLSGTSLIQRLLNNIKDLSFGTPYIVVGHDKEKIIKELGEKYHYVVQEEQLGTGHAVNAVKPSIKDAAEKIIILYGDQPFTSAKTIDNLVKKQTETGKKIVMATVMLPDFQDWRANFLGFSRVIRDVNGKIIKTVENKDATEKERKITEVNPCYFCFDAKFLWQELDSLKNDNAQKEYYLTDLIKVAIQMGEEIESIRIDPREALGANSKEELDILEKFVVQSDDYAKPI